MKLKTGDNVIVLAGKSKGTKGKIARAFPADGRVIVEGANLAKRRQKPRKQGEKGQLVEVALPLDASNVALFCSRCGAGVRVGYRIDGEKKVRICRSCSQEL